MLDAAHSLTARLVVTAWTAGALVAVLEAGMRRLPVTAALSVAVLLGGAGVLCAGLQLVALSAGRALSRGLAARGWGGPPAIAAAVVAVAAPVILLLATAAAAGRRVRALPAWPVLVGGAVATALAALFLVTRALARRPLQPPGRGGRWLPAVLLAAIAASAIWLDARLLVRRYAWFHLALELVAGLSLQAVLLLLLDRSWRRALRVGVVPFVVASLLGTGVAARWLRSPEAEGARASLFAAPGLAARVTDAVRLAPTAPAPPELAALPPPAPGPSAAAPFAGADVVLVTVDALRADHLGLHGHPRPTSPRLDALAARSVVFDRAYTPSPHTSFAIASVLSGRHAFALGRAGLLASVPMLPDRFRAAGYRTVGLFPPAVFFVEGERFRALEARRYGFEVTRYHAVAEAQDARVRTDQAIEALDNADGRPTFLWIHHFAPHEPYLSHPAVGPPFGDQAVDRYDEEIRWVDAELGRLIDWLDGRRRPYLLVVTADHGEEFGEHGGAYHGTSLYDEQVRVPLVLKLPDGGGRRVAAPASTMDIAPTLVTLVGLPGGRSFDGVDRSAAALGAPDASEPRPVFAELESLKMVVWPGQKLLCDTARSFCRWYDLGADPGERHDLARRRPVEVARGRALLADWLRRAPQEAGADGALAVALWAARRSEQASVADAVRLLGAHPDARRELRVSVASALARAARPGQRDELWRVFGAERDGEVRAWLAVALAGLGERAAVPALAEVQVQPEADPELAAHRAVALMSAGHPAGPDAALAALPAVEDVHLRCRLLASLGRARAPRAGPVLIAAYPHVRSRVCAADALVELADPATVPFLLERLRDEPYTTVRSRVARALGRTGDQAALAPLLAVFRHDPEPAIVAAAARALADLGVGALLSGRRAVRAPADARELWVVPAGGAPRPVRVLLAARGGRRARAQVGDDPRDAYRVDLPDGRPRVRVSGAATARALFR